MQHGIAEANSLLQLLTVLPIEAVLRGWPLSICFWLLLEMVHSIPYFFSELFVTSQLLLSLKNNSFHTFFNSNVFMT